jgi:hypothetical protein
MSVKITGAQLVMISAAAHRKDRCLSAPPLGSVAVEAEANERAEPPRLVGPYRPRQDRAGRFAGRQYRKGSE